MPVETIEKKDAAVKVTISVDQLSAYITITEPVSGGEDIQEGTILNALSDHRINSGILYDAVKLAVTAKKYNEQILIATGKPKQDGVDGVIEEYFSRTIEVTPYKNNDGTVDFKRLNIIREVKAGTVIARRIPPVAGVEGIAVTGDPLFPRQGRDVFLPRGLNTKVSEDGLELIAEKPGHLVFKDNKFSVETTFVVDEDVDNTTGNITFCGDVLVKGDIREGYTVSTKGNVVVKGAVEGGSIFADGNITIHGGFNGMKNGEVESKKSISSKFLQNCRATARGDIITESIINSVVFCDANLIVTKGKGIIVGGKCLVLHSVEAKEIGSEINTPTTIAIGQSPAILKEKRDLEQELSEIEESNDMVAKNMAYITRCAETGKLSEKHKQVQSLCSKQKVMNMMRESKASKRLTEIMNLIENAQDGAQVKANLVYPSVKISISNSSVIVKREQVRVRFYRAKGELITSTF